MTDRKFPNISFSKIEENLVDDLTKTRDRSNQANNVTNHAFAKKEDQAKNSRRGYGAEIAFGKLFREYPDLEDGSFGESDITLRRGNYRIEVDIKCTDRRYPHGDLIVYIKKRLKPPEAFALMFCEFSMYFFIGITWAVNVMREERIGDLGYGPTYIFPAAELMGMGEFEEDLEKRGGIAPEFPEITEIEKTRIQRMINAKKEGKIYHE